MLGTVERIDYDGDRVLKVALYFPPARAASSKGTVKEITTCERVGQGTFGTVYRALCDGYSNLALKISTGKATRLRQELDVLSKACTKGKLLLPRFEFGALNKACDLVVIGMELCVPRTLHDFLIGEKLASEADRLFLAHQATQAVSYVHEAGCIHRDIKLQNYVFDLHGNLKLIDFGLACNSLRPPPGDVVAGTVSFMAPEMAHNALHKDRRVSVGAPGDVWSLGIVLFSIFTQRNPYPSTPQDNTGNGGSDVEDEEAEASTTGTGSRLMVRSGAASQASQSTRQRLTNERLLRRVADADWRWPADCSASAELRSLVDSILVKDAAKRPTIAEVLAKKIWNLRRRSPPEALEVFLGVADDFFLSRDEAHLLRAVEERSAGVAASLMTSRMHSTDGDGLLDRDANSSGGVGEQRADREGGGGGGSGSSASSRRAADRDGRAVTPVRAAGSLKVVTRSEADGDSGPEVQIYDIRASVKKNSRPIREISQVIAEETAKAATTKAKSVGGGGGRSCSRAGAARDGKLSRSATASPVGSRASSMGSNRGNGKGRVAATAAATVAAAAAARLASDDAVLDSDKIVADGNLFDGPDNDDGLSVSANLPSSSEKAHEKPSRRAGSTSLLEGTVGDADEDGDAESAEDAKDRSKSGGDDANEDEDRDGKTYRRRRSSSKAPSQRRPRNRSIKMPTSVVLADLITDNGFLSSTSRARTGSRSQPGSRMFTPVGQSAVAAAGAPHAVTSSAYPPQLQMRTAEATACVTSAPAIRTKMPPLSPPPSVTAPPSKIIHAGAHTPSPPLSPVMTSAPRRAAPATAAAADPTLLLKQEAAQRVWVAPLLLLEHAWLLASFRLTIEEDQERYNITWLGEEQAKSAAHPHKFKEVFQVPSKKYQYGFVCDFCDYEFLPEGKPKKKLHFFHCPCGRDLCPECFDEYQRQSTCTCCGITHANSCALRDHLRKTGGRGNGKKSVASIGAASATSTGKAAFRTRGHTATPRGTPPAVAATQLPCSGRKSATTASSMHMSIAAIHQRDLLDDAGDGDLEGISGSCGDLVGATRARGHGAAAKRQRKPSAGRIETPVETLPDRPWRPFAKLRRVDAAAAVQPVLIPTAEEREVILNGQWVRHFYLYPSVDKGGSRGREEDEPFAFAYHIQPGRTGAVFLTSEFPMHSAIFSLLERQFFIVDQVNTLADDDLTRITTLVKAKSTPGLGTAYQALQEIVAYDTNLAKQRRAPGTVSVYQAPRSAYTCHGEPYVFVRWFRFNEDRSLSAFLLSTGAVQVFVNNEFELRWFDENRKFLVRCNGVCEIVGDNAFALAPAINQLLYGSFDT